MSDRAVEPAEAARGRAARGADRVRRQRLPGRRPQRHRGGAHGRRRAGDRDRPGLGAGAARRRRRGHLHALEEEYAEQQRGFTLRSVAGGWRVYSRSDYAPVVEKFLLDGQQAKLTQASLETLAVIAYRQPVSRSRVSAVRGVNVDGVVRTLLTRGLIEELGAEEESGAILYGTTAYFLQRLGLGSLDDLPALAPYLPEVDVLDELAEQGRG